MLRNTFKSLLAAIVCLAGFQPSTAFAQDDQPAVGGEVMEIQMSVDNESGTGPIVISSSSMAFASQGEGGASSVQIFTGNDIAGDWMPRGAGSANLLSLLDNESVREELELVGDQLDKYKDAQAQLREVIGEKAKSLAGGKLSPAEMGDVAKEIAELQKGRQAKLESMLLPHQLERLKQVALQIQMKQRGAANTLLSDQMVEELGIDAAQRKRIEARRKELKQELADRMAQLKLEIRDKLLAELTSEQKAKLEELSGDQFDYKPTDFRKQLKERINRRVKQRVGG